MAKKSQTEGRPITLLNELRPVSEQIACVLKSDIMTMTLAPGDLISESDIGHRFGSSRTPVREAFAQLKAEGLIITRPSRGTYVSLLSVSRIKGAQFLREAIEVAVVEKLCQNGLTQEHQLVVAECLAAQREASAAGDKEAFQRLDDAFHAAFAKAAGLDRVEAVLSREKTVLDRLRVLSLDEALNMSRLCCDHEAIFQAVVAQETNTAIAKLRQHLRLVLDTLSGLVAKKHEFFENHDT